MSVAPMAPPRARLLVTGDELLRGFVQDANSGFIAASLRDLGIELESVRILGDDHVVIGAATAEALHDVDLVVVTGGLGPTHDDRTSEAVAEALGVELRLHEDALAVVEARVRAFGRMRTRAEAALFEPGNRKQATLPADAAWVEPMGTAPGYAVAGADGRVVVVLPGPPSELRHAWRGILEGSALHELRARVGTRHERLVRIWGVPESVAAQQLVAAGHEDGPDVRVTICARDGELEVALRGTDPARVDDLYERLRGSFGDAVFACEDERPVIELVAAELLERGWRLATTESCTGGMLGSIVTAVPGSSDWFLGGFVTYSNDAKSRLAGVDPALIATHGAVSEEVARAMAAGARRALDAEVGIGITGVAGPGGGTAEKPVGTVHVAVSMPEGESARRLRIPGDRATVRRRSCTIVLHELRQLLTADRT